MLAPAITLLIAIGLIELGYRIEVRRWAREERERRIQEAINTWFARRAQ